MLERGARALAIQPRRRDEAVDPSSDHVLQQRSAFVDAGLRLFSRQAQELAFTSGHEARAEPVSGPARARLVAMEIAVEEYLYSRICPSAQTSGERRLGLDRSFSPMIRHDQHGNAFADPRGKQVQEFVDLCLEARRDVMDRCEKETIVGC